MKRLALILALVVPHAWASDPMPPPAAPAVRLPVMPPPVPPPPPPQPTAMKVLPDQLYIIDSDIACVVLSSPAGIVKVGSEAGPLRIRGKFVDGTGVVETRTYKGKFIYCVDPVGTGTVELLVIPSGTADESGVIRRVLDIGIPPPPVPPTPPTPPDPPPSPAPIPVDGFRCLIIFDGATETALSRPQQQIVYGQATRDLLNSKCVAGPDGKTKEWRIWPQDAGTTGVPKLWQDAMVRPRKELPWVIVSNGKTGYEGPLPKTVDDMATLINKYAP